MRLEAIIGLEIHVQLKTKTKMFCACPRAEDNALPNSSVCSICLGHPGTLPVPNREAIMLGTRTALAIGGNVAPKTKFDRKNYFYPDLPKGYQISQYDRPLSEGGYLDVDVPDNSLPARRTIRVRFERLHLEEDAAKLAHGAANESLVDFNRGGVPLAETVTKPDMRSPEEARAFLEEFRRILRELGVSDADMEKAQMRCDANISLRPVDENGVPIESNLRPKTEVKNMNSFRSVERALHYEIERQTDLWHMNTPPAVSSTRGWNDEKGITELQRTKEGASDYRYFPEPDIPMLSIEDLITEAKQSARELPAAKRARFMEQYFVNEIDARTLTEDRELANFFENTVSEFVAWLDALPENRDLPNIWGREGKKLSKLATGWILSKLGGLMNDRGLTWQTLNLTAKNFAEFLKIIYKEETTGPNAIKILEIMLETDADPSHVMEERGLGRVADPEAIRPFVKDIIKMNAKQVSDFKAGKEPVLKFLIGMVMRATEGKADPQVAEKIMREEIAKQAE